MSSSDTKRQNFVSNISLHFWNSLPLQFPFYEIFHVFKKELKTQYFFMLMIDQKLSYLCNVCILPRFLPI